MPVYPTDRMRVLEAEQKRSIRDIVVDAVNAHPNFDEAAASLGVTRVTLYSWCRRLKIRRNYRVEAEAVPA